MSDEYIFWICIIVSILGLIIILGIIFFDSEIFKSNIFNKKMNLYFMKYYHNK